MVCDQRDITVFIFNRKIYELYGKQNRRIVHSDETSEMKMKVVETCCTVEVM